MRLGWGECLLELRAILTKGRSRALSRWLSLISRLWHPSARAGTVLVLEGLRHQSTSEMLLKRIHGLHDPTSPQKPVLLEMQLACLGAFPHVSSGSRKTLHTLDLTRGWAQPALTQSTSPAYIVLHCT